MKKYLFTHLILCLIGWQAHAQVDQGRIVITGGVKYEFEKSKPKSGELPYELSEFTTVTSSEWKSRDLAISPSIGYFILDGLEIGMAGAFTYKFSRNLSTYRTDFGESDYRQEQKTNGFVINPYITKYFMVSTKFGLMATADIQYINEKTSNNSRQIFSSSNTIQEYASKGTQEETSLSIGMSPGLVFFISERFALKAHAERIGYSKDITKYSSENGGSEYKNKNLGLNFGSGNFMFGLSYYFGGN
ncbi:outer membrane beta-barrel protein [Pontibacter beigongshangensis]|uniref:outer membrane beta-barrel protein n=1 Tax=Pontibacter beigongshangensis TaxID=2574733 RepID=UPI001650C6BD|nr:outer membrane beta-barrel protein [Pontibacter beigongshangensis]